MSKHCLQLLRVSLNKIPPLSIVTLSTRSHAMTLIMTPLHDEYIFIRHLEYGHPPVGPGVLAKVRSALRSNHLLRGQLRGRLGQRTGGRSMGQEVLLLPLPHHVDHLRNHRVSNVQSLRLVDDKVAKSLNLKGSKHTNYAPLLVDLSAAPCPSATTTS
jgi:hypothetical protein